MQKRPKKGRFFAGRNCYVFDFEPVNRFHFVKLRLARVLYNICNER